MYKRMTAFMLIAVLLVLALFTAVSAQFTPDVFVLDQSVIDGTVKVSRAVINEPGWIVIHADDGGEIGPPIGQAQLIDGINAQVSVDVDVDQVTDQLYAMLHIDAGEPGVYEFPDGADVPLLVDDAVISPAFSIMGLEYTVLGTAINAEGFDTLVAAIEAAGLVDTLQGDGPFTVFAPTDEAFAALPEGTLDELLADPEALGSILRHHVVAGAILSGDLENDSNLASWDGHPLMITIDQDGVSIEEASIVIPDIEAYNGVVHAIDAVLIPPSADEEADEEVAGEEESASEDEAGEEASEEEADSEEASDEGDSEEEAASEEEAGEDGDADEEAAEEGDSESQFGDIVETAIAAGEFETLVAAVQAAELVDTLKGDGPFTVLAPTDAAFAELPEETLTALLNDPEELANVLLYHVIPGSVLSTDLSDGLEAATAQGDSLTFGISDSGATVNGVDISVTDILASNGVIHIIDKVLLPQASDEMDGEEMTDDEEMSEEEMADDEEMSEEEMEANDIVSVAAGADEFTTLAAAIEAAGLQTTLQGEGPFTVFAPTNAAFEKLPEGALDSLLADRDALIDLLFYHVINGNLLSSGISDGLSVSTLEGSDLEFAVTADGVQVNDATVVIADIAASNGIIHAIDTVLSPLGEAEPEPTAEPTVEPTPVPSAPTTLIPTPDSPDTLPETGISLGSFGKTVPVISLVFLALFGIALFERKKR